MDKWASTLGTMETLQLTSGLALLVILCTATFTDRKESPSRILPLCSSKMPFQLYLMSNFKRRWNYYNDSLLTCSATATDLEETPTVSYSWSSSGVTRKYRHSGSDHHKSDASRFINLYRHSYRSNWSLRSSSTYFH